MGISKSEASRGTIEAETRVLKELAERDLSALDVLAVYVDGIVFGEYHVLAAVGVDATSRKHVLGLREVGSENATVVAGLLEDLVERGLRADRRRLFVIDGAKALRSDIAHVFGAQDPFSVVEITRSAMCSAICRGQSPRSAAAPVPDDDEHHRLVTRGGSSAHAARQRLAERRDGGALGGNDVPEDGEELPTYHRLPASVDAEGAPR